MGVDVYLLGGFLVETLPGSVVEDTIEAFRANGFETDPDGEDGPVASYEIQSDDDGASAADPTHDADPSLAAVVERIRETGEGEIGLWYDEAAFRVTFDLGSDSQEHPAPVTVSGPDSWWVDADEIGYDTAERRAATLVEAFDRVSTVLDPVVGFLALRNDHAGLGKYPSSDPEKHGLTRLPWLLLLDETWVDYCGGRDHVLDTPAYDVHVLPTESVVVRQRDQPWAGVDEIDSGPSGSAFEHLFEE